jgi:TATA-binding protein-associated factor Taf7
LGFFYGLINSFEASTITTITIDNIEYALDSLSEDAKAQFVSLQSVDQKIAQLNAEVAGYQTARSGYSNPLKAATPKDDGNQEKH